MRNYRIGTNGFLNQRCALTPNLESILRARVRKIFLQQYRPKADMRIALMNVYFLRISGPVAGATDLILPRGGEPASVLADSTGVLQSRCWRWCLLPGSGTIGWH